jgi:hypothetical protein
MSRRTTWLLSFKLEVKESVIDGKWWTVISMGGESMAGESIKRFLTVFTKEGFADKQMREIESMIKKAMKGLYFSPLYFRI